MLGAFIGDSLGSYLEFRKGEQDQAEVAKCMKMEGGGYWELAPGQITDDSELAMCLMHGLIEGKGKLNAAAMVKYYGKWYKNGPFDIGYTTRNALSMANPSDPDPELVRYAAEEKNYESLSNGALMRATPIAVWS